MCFKIMSEGGHTKGYRGHKTGHVLTVEHRGDGHKEVHNTT